MSGIHNVDDILQARLATGLYEEALQLLQAERTERDAEIARLRALNKSHVMVIETMYRQLEEIAEDGDSLSRWLASDR